MRRLFRRELGRERIELVVRFVRTVLLLLLLWLLVRRLALLIVVHGRLMHTELLDGGRREDATVLDEAHFAQVDNVILVEGPAVSFLETCPAVEEAR